MWPPGKTRANGSVLHAERISMIGSRFTVARLPRLRAAPPCDMLNSPTRIACESR
jgi:hypothetical protein